MICALLLYQAYEEAQKKLKMAEEDQKKMVRYYFDISTRLKKLKSYLLY